MVWEVMKNLTNEVAHAGPIRLPRWGLQDARTTVRDNRRYGLVPQPVMFLHSERFLFYGYPADHFAFGPSSFSSISLLADGATK